jgi:cytochrome P450
MEDQVRGICRGLLSRAGEQGEIDLVHDVCSGLPSQVIGELMGLPQEDRARLHAWAERQTSGQDPDVSGGSADDASAASIEMAMYAIELAGTRRAEEPRDDLTSLILGADFGGEPMSEMDFGAFFVQLVTAANDTTKGMLAAGTLALVEHPDQLAALRADPSGLPVAVEEVLRFANPLHYFRRTATRDADIGGTAVREGDKVAMIYTSANRDETVFAEPHRFDTTRDPNPHLSFGIGGHFCLGAHLARLEGRVFFEEMLATFPTIEVTGAPTRVRSNLNNALKRLPVRLTRA